MNIIIVPPIIIKSLLVLKNELKVITDKPNIKNVIEVPNVKNKVFLNKELLTELLLFNFSTLLFNNILKYIGNIGIIHSDKNDSRPYINTTIKFNFSIKLSLFY